jgi:fructose-bisphosphate aldolase class II
MMINAAKTSKVDIAVHLDHGSSYEVIERALNMGFTSVMYDGSTEPFEVNIEKTRRIKKLAENFGADVEAELGLVGRSEGGETDHGICCTVPEDAKIFAEQTGVDALAIAIGNQHGNYPAAPQLRFDILREIHSLIPEQILVLHGGSGISDDDFRRCIKEGIGKVNIATAILNEMVKEAKQYLAHVENANYYEMNRKMVEGAYRAVKHHIQVFNMI